MVVKGDHHGDSVDARSAVTAASDLGEETVDASRACVGVVEESEPEKRLGRV